MKCEEIRERLTAYLDLELSVEERQGVKDHLAACSLCSEEVNGFKKVGQWVQLTQLEPDSYFQKQVLRGVRLRKEPVKVPFWSPFRGSFFYPPVFRRAALAFVFLLAVSGAYTLGYHSRPLFVANSEIISQPDLEKINQEIEFYQNYEVIHQLDLLKKMNQQKEGEQKL